MEFAAIPPRDRQPDRREQRRSIVVGMAFRMTVAEVVERLARPPDPPLIAIDGLPCSGKSTLAETIAGRYGYDCLQLDDFIRPEAEWPSRVRPAFPFEYIRYDEFIDAVRSLASTGECVYAPFDGETLTVSTEPRRITLRRPVIVEGVSALNPVLMPLYGLKLFVDSDRATVLRAAEARGGGVWLEAWRTLFLPSVDLYMRTLPEQRADIVIAGRGAEG